MVKLTVKASLAGSGYPRRVTFPGEAFALERDDLALKLARSFSLQPGSFRLAYLDDDNERIEVASTADLREALDYFSTDASSSASSSSGWFGKGAGPSTEIVSITLKLEILVEYDGPALSDTTSSVYSFGDGPPSRRGSSSAGSDVGAGWQRSAWPRSASRSRIAKSRARPASLSGSSDGGSDGWLREQAYSRSRGQQDAPAMRDDREDDDWERRTVSSVSQPFDTSRPSIDEAPSRNAYDHYASHDTSRIPPPHENGSHDALFPNFARGRFSHHPHPYPPAPLEPLIPTRASPYQYLPPHGTPHGFGWSHFPPPPLPPPPQHGFAGLFPPHPGFYPPPPFPRPGSSLPSLSLSNGSGPSLQSDFGPSPTPSQRERARDLFASSSEEGSMDGGSESGQGEDARTSYTVTTSSEDAGEEAEGGGEVREEKCVRCDKALVGARFVCAVCEAYLLCQECEGLPPLLPSSTSSETHDDSHILLKIPASVASSVNPRAVNLARARASSLASAGGSSGSAGTAAPEPNPEGVADYWNWWASWYSTLPPVPPHPSHPPPPPPSSWYPPSALSVPPPPPAPTRGPSAPPATLAHLASLTPSSTASSAVSYTRPLRPPLRFPYPSHGVSCTSCSRTIPGPDSSFGEPLPPGSVEQGVRWLCANCPTVPSVDLCPECEASSQAQHDPSHAFLRITHPIRRPLPSVKALLPLLYLPSPTTSGADGASDLVDLRSDAGRTSVDDGTVETGRADQEIVHDRVVCDACDRYIRGPWLRCCHCPQSFDLCEPCLLSGASLHAGHNPSHVFVKLRRKVDLPQLSRLTRLETRRPRGLLEVDLYA